MWDAGTTAMPARMSWIAPWPCPCTAGWCWLTERIGAATTWVPSSASQPPLSCPLLSSLRLPVLRPSLRPASCVLCALRWRRPWWAPPPPSRVRWEGFFPGGARGREGFFPGAVTGEMTGKWMCQASESIGVPYVEWEYIIGSTGSGQR